MTNSKNRYVAAMSGGVDSSVAAYLFKERGYQVIGVTLKLKSCNDRRERVKSCCGIDDNIQVKLVSDILDIPHYFLDVREEFEKKILRYAWNEYKIGKTPSPCLLCNFYLKFGYLIDFAKRIGANGVITGHYAIIERNGDSIKLFKGIDDNKNQTYFLALLTKDQLRFSYMPLGRFTKKEVRNIAEKLKLPNAKKAESQDACFGYKGETFAETLYRKFGNEDGGDVRRGKIYRDNGEFLGYHNGIHNFTIGQRKGLNIALGKPAYVVDIDSKENIIIVSTDQSKLFSIGLMAKDMNWIDFPYNELECEVQTRYRQAPKRALVKRLDGNRAEVLFSEPVRAITPGQAVAVYKGNQLIAGGWIESAIKR